MKSKLILIALAVLFSQLCPSIMQAQVFSTKGKSFILAFLPNIFSDATINAIKTSITISSEMPANGTVTIPGTGFSQVFSVPANSSVSIIIPADQVNIIPNETVINRAVFVNADVDVSVYALNFRQFTSDAANILPSAALGSEYIINSINQAVFPNASEFIIVSQENNFGITIEPSVPTLGGRTAPFTIQLNRGDCFLVRGAGGADLSRTRITAANGNASCSGFAVFSGNECTNIGNCGACDHLYEQEYPVLTWGTEFITVPLQARLNGNNTIINRNDIYRVVATNEGAVLRRNGTVAATLGPRGSFDFTTGVPEFIQADKPISLTQYSRGTGCDNTASDPFALRVNPLQQMVRDITFSTFNPSGNIKDFFANIVLKSSDAGLFRLNGNPVNFQTVPANPTYSFVQIPLSTGTFTASGADAVLAIYGFGAADSYGYMGGARVQNLNEFVEIPQLNPDSALCPGQTSDLIPRVISENTIRSWKWIMPDNSERNTKQTTVNFPDPGTYTVRLVFERAIGCRFDTIKTVIVVRSPVKPLIRDTVLCMSESASIKLANPGGIAPFTYQWSSPNGLILESPVNSDNITFRSNKPGIFSLIIRATDKNGCLGQDTALITVLDTMKVRFTAPTDTLCAGTIYTIAAQPSGGTGQGYRFKWLKNQDIISADTLASVNILVNQAGRHSFAVQVTDSRGCSTIDSVLLFAYPPAAISAGNDLLVLCIGDTLPLGTNASINGGNPPYTLRWSRISAGFANIVNDTILTTGIYPTVPGFYELKAVDSRGCVYADTVFADVRLIPDANAGPDVSECVCETKGMQIGIPSRCGVPPFIYKWTSLDAPISTLSLANTVPVSVLVPDPVQQTTRYRYVLTVTDGQNQTRSDTVVYTKFPCPVITMPADTFICGPASPFRLNAKATGEGVAQTEWTPSDFLDNPNRVDPVISLPDSAVQKVYILTAITDAGCITRDTIRIATASRLSVKAEIQKSKPNCICRGDQITLNSLPSGGTPPYTFSWTGLAIANNDRQSSIATPLQNSLYTILITDARGCTATDTISVCVEPVPNPRPAADTTICAGDRTPARGLPATCGKEPFTYTWTPARGISSTTVFNPEFFPDTTTLYTLTVTDAAGASTQATMRISINPLPVLRLNVADTQICQGSFILLRANASGGSGNNYKYQWLRNGNAMPGENADILSAGPMDTATVFTCILQDGNNCSVQAQSRISVVPKPVLSFEQNILVCPCDSARIGGLASSGAPPYTYKWFAANGNTATDLADTTAPFNVIKPLGNTSYTLVATDANGCTTSRDISIQYGDPSRQIQFTLPDIISSPKNKNVLVPVGIKGFPKVQNCPPRSLEFSISYNAWVFDPQPQLVQGTIINNSLLGDIRTVRIRIAPVPAYDTNDIVTTLKGAALLGAPGQTNFDMHSIVWGCSLHRSDSAQGSLVLDSLCDKPNNSVRLLEFSKNPMIMAIQPNPARDIFYISAARHKNEPIQLSIVNMSGIVQHIMQWPAQNDMQEQKEEIRTFMISGDLPQGVYRVLLRSTEHIVSEQLMIIR
jgi:PKD repeat protein